MYSKWTPCEQHLWNPTSQKHHIQSITLNPASSYRFLFVLLVLGDHPEQTTRLHFSLCASAAAAAGQGEKVITPEVC